MHQKKILLENQAHCGVKTATFYNRRIVGGNKASPISTWWSWRRKIITHNFDLIIILLWFHRLISLASLIIITFSQLNKTSSSSHRVLLCSWIYISSGAGADLWKYLETMVVNKLCHEENSNSHTLWFLRGLSQLLISFTFSWVKGHKGSASVIVQSGSLSSFLRINV